jgi:hypothetical protein
MTNHDSHESPKNYWAKELEKPSLAEPKLTKFMWVKPLSLFHTLEFKGI